MEQLGGSGIGKMAELQFQATVAFRDVAAYFSEKEWARLEEGKKELYKRAMENIHLVILSLGHTIANPDVLVKITADNEVHVGDPQSPGTECLDHYSTNLSPMTKMRKIAPKAVTDLSPMTKMRKIAPKAVPVSQTTQAPDILLRISTDEVPRICKQEPPNTGSQDANVPESINATNETVLCYDHDYGTKTELQNPYDQIVNVPKSSLTDSELIIWNNENPETNGEVEVIIPCTPTEKPAQVLLWSKDIQGPHLPQGINPQVKGEQGGLLKNVCAMANMRKIAPKALPETSTSTEKTANIEVWALAKRKRIIPKARPDIRVRAVAKIHRIAPKGGAVFFSEPSMDMVEIANVETSTSTVEIANVEPITSTVEMAKVETCTSTMEMTNVEPTTSDLQGADFGSVYSMFNMNYAHRGQLKHVVTAEELGRRFAEPESFSLRFAQRYLRQQKHGVSALADKCRLHNLQPSGSVGLTSAWTLITEGDVKYLLESTQALAAEYWPSKDIAGHLSHISQSSSRALQLEHTRDYLENLQSSLDEKLVIFDLITHGGAIQLVNLVIDCIKSTIEEEMALQPTE